MVLILSGCENLMTTSEKHKEDNNLNILNIEFEPEHKYFHTDVKLNDSIAALLLRNDTTIKFHVEEYMQNRLSDPRTVPELVNIQNIKVPRPEYPGPGRPDTRLCQDREPKTGDQGAEGAVLAQ